MNSKKREEVREKPLAAEPVRVLRESVPCCSFFSRFESSTIWSSVSFAFASSVSFLFVKLLSSDEYSKWNATWSLMVSREGELASRQRSVAAWWNRTEDIPNFSNCVP